jgi:hypothetical protein
MLALMATFAWDIEAGTRHQKADHDNVFQIRSPDLGEVILNSFAERSS